MKINYNNIIMHVWTLSLVYFYLFTKFYLIYSLVNFLYYSELELILK